MDTKTWIVDSATAYYPAPDITAIDTDLALIKEKFFADAKDGITVIAKPIIREMEFSGKMGRKVVEAERITGWDISAEGSFLGITETLLKACLFEKTTDSSTKFDKYVAKEQLAATDYNNLVIVGKNIQGEALIIVIKNTYNEEGLGLETKDLDESGCKAVFKGHYKINSNKAPIDVYMIKDGQVLEV